MRSTSDGSSPRPSSPPNAFHPTFLESVQDQPEPLTASEADLAGPWHLEAVPGFSGSVAVLRAWECQAEGDLPTAVLVEEESAALYAAALPLHGREPLFHLSSKADESGGPLPGGYPFGAIYGEQGFKVRGWQRRYQPEAVAGLHLMESLVRSPQALAELLLAAGGGALAQVGRILARRLAG
jgi:hypothetical protein